MSNWVAMSMRRLLGRGRKFSNLATAASAGRFHPNLGGCISIMSGGESPIPAAGKSPLPLPLAILPPEMVTDVCGVISTNNATHYYNFVRIEKQLDGIHKKLFLVEKNYNQFPWEKLMLPDDAICRSSSHGWLALVHPCTREVGLFNPFLLPNNNNNLVSFPYIPLPRSNTIKGLHCRRIYKADYLSNCPSVIREHRLDSFILNKLALSCAPPLVGGGGYQEEVDCNVMAISELTKKLLFCKLGDSTWANLKGSFQQYSDVIYFTKHGRFFAVQDSDDDQLFNIESWDFTDPCCPNNTLIQPSIEGSSIATNTFPFNPQGWRAEKTRLDKYGQVSSRRRFKRYLVDASGDLLLVLRTVSTDVDKDGFLIEWSSDMVNKQRDWNDKLDDLNFEITVGFSVFKMDWTHNKWEPVESLGDKALFLGLNHSFSVSTHDLPQVMHNSIYFTDDRNIHFNPQGYDSGVYNMEDGFISGVLPSSLQVIKQLPVWVLPNPN